MKNLNFKKIARTGAKAVFYGALTTVGILGVYAIPQTAEVNTGDLISKTVWNTLVGNLNAVVTKVSNITNNGTGTGITITGDVSSTVAVPETNNSLTTKSYVDSVVVAAGGGGGGGGSCYYTTSPICLNGTVKAPGTYTTGGSSDVAHNICCNLDSSVVCSAYAPGGGCQNNTIYAGYLSGSHYMTTPGGCDDLANPFCTGYTDSLIKTWIAAKDYCDSMNYGGYSDWFLPSISELDFLYTNRLELGGFNSDFYWSRNERDTYTAYGMGMIYRDSSYDLNKGIARHVRCLRKL